MIDLVNKIGHEDIYYGVRSPNRTCESGIDHSSTCYLVYILQNIFESDDRNYFPLLPYDDFKQWFSSVFTQIFTAWFDNHFSQELSSFYRLNELLLFTALVESNLDLLRDDLIEKRKEEIKLISDACSVCLS
ncbi:hypothetical protein [Bartonella sp. B1099]|uniref:hypothetical protein n=1 Tax=Bartonella sp. B1099 TaxID=2911422 RepID=UPI0020C58C1D|nr:hypothetical protein [Bartonella sp. B1099]